MSGRISFIGAGPGAADLITIRGARRLAEADVVIWSSSAVAAECVREHARSDVELVDASQLSHEQGLELYRRAERDHANVARVHSGDPALWNAVQAQYEACCRMQLEVEIVPGVPEFTAAAATVGRDLTTQGANSVLLGKFDGQAGLLNSASVREFVDNGTTMALSLPASRVGQLVEELRGGGHADDVPVLIAYKVTWPDELVLRTTLAELEATVKKHKLWRNALFLVGQALHTATPPVRAYSHGHVSTRRWGGSRGRFSSSGETQGATPAQRASSQHLEEQASQQAYADVAVESEPQETETPDETLLPAPRVTDSDLAWWAVRDWQEATRQSREIPAQDSETDGVQQELAVVEQAQPDGAGAERTEQTPKRTRRSSTATSRAKPAKTTARNSTTSAKTASAPKGKSSGKRKTTKRDQPDE